MLLRKLTDPLAVLWEINKAPTLVLADDTLHKHITITNEITEQGIQRLVSDQRFTFED